MMIDTVFQYICPVLIVMWISFGFARLAGMNAESGNAAKGIVIIISFIVALMPVKGLSLSDYILSVNPNFSIGSIALLIIVFFRSTFNRNLLSRSHLLSLILWNISISLLVIIPALGFFPVDMYFSGYGSYALFALMAMVTIILVVKNSPLLYIFIAYIVAYNLRLLPSTNFLDYITDGMLLLFSLGALVSISFSTHTSSQATRF